MVKAQQTFINEAKHEICVTIEPVCNYCLLHPGDRLTLIYTVPSSGDALRVILRGPSDLWIDPVGFLEYQVLVNGQPAEDLSWKFER